MPKAPNSAGPPRLHSPVTGASPHVGRRPSPLSRSHSQTATVLEFKGSIEQTKDVPKLTVVASGSIAPSQSQSTDTAPSNRSVDLGHQSAPNDMQIVDPDPLPSQSSRTPSVPQDNHGQSKLPAATGRSDQAVSQAPQAHTGAPAPENLGHKYGSSMDAMDADPPPLQNNRIPFRPQGYGQNKLPIATGHFNQTASQASQTYTGPPAPESVQTGFQAPYVFGQPQSWNQSQGQFQRQH